MSAPNAARLEYKALGGDAGSTLLAADDATGVVEALVSVTGIPDEVNDIILPGAYKDSLVKRKPKVIFGHDWQKWVARTEEVKELLPGDPALPKTARDGNPWPAAAGALYIKAKFNLDTPEGKSCYSNVRFFSETGECEWSIGYRVPSGQSTRTKSGQRSIRKLDLYEASPVLFGAAPLSGTLTVKDAKATPEFEDKAAAADPDDDPQDPITAEADEDDPDMQALHEAAIREMNESPEHWDAIDAASAIDPGEEEITSSTADALQAADQRRQGAKGISLVGLEGKDAKPKPAVKVSDKPWSDFKPADYTPQQWHKATLVHDHAPNLVPEDKQGCKLPVKEPDGTVNRNAVHAAAGALNGARGGLNASAGQKKTAAGLLRGLYKKIGEMPPSSLQSKALTSADVTGTPPTGPSGPIQLRAREAQAFTGNPDSYTLPQWHDATIVHQHPDGQMPSEKGDCALPVSTPDGALSIDGMHQAAQSLAAGEPGTATDAERNDGAVALSMLFRRTGETPPDSLGTKTAGQDMTPADARATARLKDWYEHGGGAAQINWGVAGDFDRCVSIAGKHMDPAKAAGFCQLRHKSTTGHYAGHAPGEQAGHGAAAAVAGKKGVIDPSELGMPEQVAADVDAFLNSDTEGFERIRPHTKVTAYDPSLEQGEFAGHLTSEVKSATATAPIEEHLDRVAAAVTTALGGGAPGDDGTPRRIVAVGGTWADHAIALAFDSWGTPDDGETFRVPFTVGEDGSVLPGTPEPVTLILGGDGTKSAGGDALSPLPVLVEHVTAFIGRGLRTEVKGGRVLSDSNAKLLQGAVDQLIVVLGNAGIQVGVKENQEPDADEQALNEGSSSPLYIPDSTAPAAQVAGTKVILDPALMARGLQITAAAADLRSEA